MWGDPQIECKPCNCNPMGVDPNHAQCEPVTGKCFCLEGWSSLSTETEG